MWQVQNVDDYTVEDLYQRTDFDQLEDLRRQVAEQKLLQSESRKREKENADALELKVRKEREQMRLEYEAEKAMEESRKKLASRRRANNMKRLEDQIKNDNKNKKKLRRPPENQQSVWSEIPKIVVESPDHNKPSKRDKNNSEVLENDMSGNFKNQNRVTTSKPISTSNPRKSTALPTISTTHETPEPMNGPKIYQKTHRRSSSLDIDDFYKDYKVKMKGGKRFRLPIDKSNTEGRLESKSQSLDKSFHFSSDQGNTRRKLPNASSNRSVQRSRPKSADNIGQILPPIEMNQKPFGYQRNSTKNSPILYEKQRISNGSQDYSNFQSGEIYVEDHLTGRTKKNKKHKRNSHSSPVNAWRSRSPVTPTKPGSSPATFFDWKVKLEDTTEDVIDQAKKSQKNVKLFKTRNVDIFDQLSALKRELENPENLSDYEDIEDVESDTDKSESKQSETTEAFKNDGENFNKKQNPEVEENIDFNATNKTVLKSFLQRFSRQKTSSK